MSYCNNNAIVQIIAITMSYCKQYPGMHPKKCGKQGKGGDSPRSAFVSPHLQYCAQLWAQEGHGPLGVGPEETFLMSRVWSTSPTKRALVLFSLEKRRL